MKEQRHSLTEKDCILLERYHDGECGVWARMSAERLLSRSEAALAFLEGLKDLSDINKDYSYKISSRRCDLWSKIEKRIDEEERAEFFLGKRTKESSENKRNGWSLDWSKVGWGLSGAFVTAAFGMVMFRLASLQPIQVEGDNKVLANIKSSQTGGVMQAQQVKLNEYPVSIGRSGSSIRRPVEVDWMRSDGRVHIIQDQEDRSSIIWVKKKRSSSINDQILSIQQESMQEERSDRPRIINQRIPESLSVSDIK